MSSSPNIRSSKGRNKVVVVDDEGSVLLLVRRILSHEGYDVTICATAEEALQCLELQAHDCLITDAMMPDVSGYDLVEKVRNHPVFNDLPIIMLTRKQNKEDIQKAMLAGVTDYIVKPIDEQMLLKKVKLSITRNKDSAVEGFEIPVQDMTVSEAILEISCRITHISELGLKVKSQIALKPHMWFQLKGTIMESIGIETPYMRVLECHTSSTSDGFYEVKLCFIGLREKDGTKIRAWMVKEAQARKNRTPV